MRTRRIAAASLVAVLMLPGVTPQASAGTSSCYRYNEREMRLLQRTNSVRAEKGLGELRLDPELSKVAAKHARVMARKGRLFHTPDDLLAWRVTNWNGLGENVGVGSTVASVQQAFLASPSHAANILHPGFEHIGVGVARRGGSVWITVEFESVRDPGTRLRMPTC